MYVWRERERETNIKKERQSIYYRDGTVAALYSTASRILSVFPRKNTGTRRKRTCFALLRPSSKTWSGDPFAS